MRRITRRWIRWILLTLAVALVAVVAVVWTSDTEAPPRVTTSEFTLDVDGGPDTDDQVRIDATYYVPERTPAPAVLVAHGFGGTKDSVEDQARDLAERGFVALAYTARGFGASTGRIALNSPDHEVADASALVDWLAEQPEVTTDGPNDPRLGVTGGSYGGALSLLLAGTDDRVDALAPMITYNDLEQALIPNAATDARVDTATPAPAASEPAGVFKQAWAGTLFTAGMGGGPGQGRPPDGSGSDPADASGSCGRFSARVCAAYTELATTGQASTRTRELLRSVSPNTVTDQITQPTLLIQGEQDTLFGLDHADANARQIHAAGGTVKVAWYDGGHDGGGPGPGLNGAVVDWFRYHLDGAGEDPGTEFEYAVEGTFRVEGSPSVRTVTAAAYPGLARDSRTERRTVPVAGDRQTVLNPPGGSPASVSGLPGLGPALGDASRLAGRIAIDMPGQSARFTSEPLDKQLLITGASTVRLRVSAVPGDPVTEPEGAVLFAKLYDVAPDDTRALPGSAVAPLRIPELPADGTPVEVTVTLPGIVRPVEADHRIELVVTTTDQAYATPDRPSAFRVELAGDGADAGALSVPVVPGTRSDDGLPTGTLAGIGIVLGVLVLAAGLGGLVRRRRRNALAAADPELRTVPLVIENLSKSYPGGVVAVDDLSFRVEAGQVLGLLGPNGAGKTTTLRMLMGLIRPTDGAIRVFGHRVASGAPVLSRIGSFVEGAGFLPHLSGKANLELYWAATGRPARRAHFAEAMEIAGLGDAVHRRVRTYSQGMRQRLAIAQAMLGLPDLLVLDEPTNGLDPPQIHQMREVLRRYAATGRTVVVSSHLLAEVEQTCDHVVVMHHGRLVATGAVGVIMAGATEATFVVEEPDQAAEVLRELDGVEEVTVDGTQVHADLDGLPRSAALAALVRAGVTVERAGPRRRLEDAFLQLVGEAGE